MNLVQPASTSAPASADEARTDLRTLLLRFGPAEDDQTLAPPLVIATSDRHLGKAFGQVAREAFDRPAVVTASASFAYGDLLQAASIVRDRLRANPAFRVGDRVVLWLPNGAEYVAGFYGTLLAGGIIVPVPPDVELGRLRHILTACDAGHVLTSEAVFRRRRPTELGDPKAVQLRAHSGAQHGSDDPSGAPELPDGDSPAAIFFTSGSTGEPKGVTLSHGNLLSNARSIGEYLEVTREDRALGLLPFYHAFGNSVLQTHLLAGATVVVAGSLTFPQSILEAVDEHQVTSLSGVPDLFRTLLDRSSLGTIELPSLRYLAVAGGRLDPDQALVLAAKAAPARLFVMYGQTEATARLSYLPPELIEEKFGSIGKGIPGVELQVVDEAGRPVPPGVVGELRGRGPNVMLGYWRDPEGTAAVLRGGWLYTGDLATVDADGFVYPQGRRSGLVKIAGYRVHPSELEEFLRREADLLEVVAVPYEAPGLGTRFALFAQPWEGVAAVSADEIRAICARGLPRHKVPEHVEVVDRFPLNDAYKVDRVALRRRAEQAALAGAK